MASKTDKILLLLSLNRKREHYRAQIRKNRAVIARIQHMRRKRRACFLFFANLFAYLQQLPVREIWVKPRANLVWCMAEDQWTDNEWMGNLRMSKVTFQKLCEELAPFIERRDMNYHKAISLRERVAITLYRLADTVPVIAQCQISLAWENEQFAKSCSRYVPALLKFCSRDLFTCPLLDKTLRRKLRLSSCVRAFPR